DRRPSAGAPGLQQERRDFSPGVSPRGLKAPGSCDRRPSAGAPGLQQERRDFSPGVSSRGLKTPGSSSRYRKSVGQSAPQARQLTEQSADRSRTGQAPVDQVRVRTFSDADEDVVVAECGKG